MEKTYTVFGTLYLKDKGFIFLLSLEDFATQDAIGEDEKVIQLPQKGSELSFILAQDAGRHEGLKIEYDNPCKFKVLDYYPGITSQLQLGILIKEV